MKKIFLFICMLSFATILLGQRNIKAEPLIIKGQLTNCPEKYLRIFFEDKNGALLIDTIPIDKSGNFYLKTFKIKNPQRTSIQQKNIQINDIFVAPGYNLTITGDAKDFISLFKTTKIEGIGAESNNYRAILNLTIAAQLKATPWYELNEDDLLIYIYKSRKLRDSVAHIVFDKKPIRDKYLAFFKSMVRLDNKFINLYYLAAYVNMNKGKFNYEKSSAFVKNNFDNNILNNLSKDEYLVSKDYRSWIIVSEYLDYLVNLDYLKDSTLRSHNGYKLEKANKVYTGKVREYVLHKYMESTITFCKSFDKLNYYKEQFKPYLAVLYNPFYKKSIETKFSEKEAELLSTAIGKPAPPFTLESNSGSTFSLSDFKGKVVYLDLWASWCSPCRAETPGLKELFHKYKDDNRIAFVSIAVSDGINEWKKALQQDKPDWIQLLDKDAIVSKSYVANTIPQFIIIDKQGNIVNFNAPRPSSGKELESLLISEIIK